MPLVDLNADIVPGVGAAGFRIGQTFAEIQLAELSYYVVPRWNESRDPLGFAIEETEGWLLYDLRIHTTPERLETRASYNHGAIELAFSTRAVLYNVSVYSGYHGRFADTVQIGDRLDKVLAITNLFYDSGDEMHFPTEDSSIRGIGFYTGDGPLELSPDQEILGISVHDWSLQ
jgi:hypothetical protein